MRKYYFFIAILFVGFSCSGPNKEVNKTGVMDSIDSMENKLYNSQDVQMSKEDATNLILLYQQFAKEFPNDTLAPLYLFRASDLSMNLQRPKETIKLFDLLLENYPDYEKTSSVLFLKAFVYEDQLRDLDNARKYYLEFLEKYPESDFADDAEMSLKNLGKTPEELILEFEKNQ
jgi:TolA-binding protein